MESTSEFATIVWRIGSFQTLRKKTGEKIDPKLFTFHGHAWELAMCPKGLNPEFVSVFLALLIRPSSPNAVPKVHFTLAMDSSKGHNGIIKDDVCTFTSADPEWRCPQFLLRSQVLNPVYGYVDSDDGSITLRLTMQTVPSDEGAGSSGVGAAADEDQASTPLSPPPGAGHALLSAGSPSEVHTSHIAPQLGLEAVVAQALVASAANERDAALAERDAATAERDALMLQLQEVQQQLAVAQQAAADAAPLSHLSDARAVEAAAMASEMLARLLACEALPEGERLALSADMNQLVRMLLGQPSAPH